MSNKIIQNALERAGKANRSLTPEGLQWLVAALDPYHDTPIRDRGMPDDQNNPTVTLEIKKSINISAPTGTVGNWAAHIFTLPEAMDVPVFRVNRAQGQVLAGYYNGTAWANTNAPIQLFQGNAATLPGLTTFGPINVHSWTTDVGNFYPNGVLDVLPAAMTHVNALPTTVDQSTLAQPAFNSKFRVVAAGFEISNTTAPLYAQGLITSSRVKGDSYPQASQVVDWAGNQLLSSTFRSLNSPFFPSPLIWSPGPPSTISEAMAYAGSKQWPAALGAYVVCTFDAEQNNMRAAQPIPRVFQNNDVVDTALLGSFPATGYGTATQHYIYSAESIIPTTTYWSRDLPLDISSIIMTGLSLQTTFEVNINFTIEVSAHLLDPGFGPFVYAQKPPPETDDLALELYGILSRELPPGVPVSMNPSGEWWGMVASLALEYAPQVYSAFKAVAPLVSDTTTGAYQGGADPVAQGVADKRANRASSLAMLGRGPRTGGRSRRRAASAPTRRGSRASSRASSRGSVRSRSSARSASRSVRVQQPRSAMKKQKKK